MTRVQQTGRLIVFIVIGSLPTIAFAADDKPAPKFDIDIRPVLKAKCWKCHGDDVRKAELALHTPDGIRKGSESGEILIPGKSAESRLFEVLHEGEMPPDKKDPLTAEQVELFRKWIDAGALFGDTTTAAKPEISQHDIIPILLLRCTACHGRQQQEAGLDLRNRASMLRGGKSGPVFVPGKPDQSLILKRIHAEEMPPRDRLTEVSVKPMEASEVEKLTQWIALGAPEVVDEHDIAGTAADPLVRAEERLFWSFVRPQRPAVPVVNNLDQVRNPLDTFILQKLEPKGLKLAAEADRATLLRRAAFDLTGLPPEPADVDAFLSDSSPDAYEKVLERLLSSSRYGERWGRHWLDVAGYSDCEGRREQHLPRQFAWRYRDYVIRAFNSDKPFDRFLLEQIAGDELADYSNASVVTKEMEDNLVATAFLRMSPDPTWANLTGYVPDRLEVMADMLDVLGSGVMGMTFKCARCHTHKFDPIPQRDYYRLVAVLKGAYDEHDWLKPELQSYGGALSAGFGERLLSNVSSDERTRWQQHNDQIQKQIDAVKALPQTPETVQKANQLAGQKLAEPKIMAMWDRGEPSPTYIYRRGDYQNSGPLVQPGIPSVLSDVNKPFEIIPPFSDSKSTGRRLAFARWLVEPDQPLTSRVMVNRIWKLHFGQGIVRSLGNFGKIGDPPTHPELLDWLAVEFVRQGWSVKAMHRTIMTSAVYRQSSAVTTQQAALDPDNRLLSRMPLRRMEAELLRDTLLLVSGQLNESSYGGGDPVHVRADGLVLSSKRRSIYIQQLRKHPVSLLESFDLPAMNPNCLQRSESLVAPQALQLLNDSAIRDLSSQFAARVLLEAGSDSRQQIDRIYQIALSRPPATDELSASLAVLNELKAEWSRQLTAAGSPSKSQADQKALATFCHTMMNSAAFLYID